MNKMDKWITKFIVYATPLVVIILGWAAWQLWNDPQGADSLHGKSFAFMALAVCFLVWIVSLFYIVVKMVLVQRLRDEILGGIAGMKERDERESAIVGEAAKVSFLSTMAFMILLDKCPE